MAAQGAKAVRRTDMADPLETLQLPQTSRVAKERQEQILKDFEMRRKIQSTVVPTDSAQVKQVLRNLGEPITLFGEREMERRERLKRIVAERDVPLSAAHGESGQEMLIEVQKDQKEVFYTEGVEELMSARQEIAQWSLVRGKSRIATAKRKRETGEETDAASQIKSLGLNSMMSESSEIADARPVNCCVYSPDSSLILTAGWSGVAKVWSAAECKLKVEFQCHDERCTGAAWHPHSTQETSGDVLSLATASADSTAKLWTNTGKLLKTLEGHTDRLARIAFHPMGKHLATASFDTTWRFWDVTTGVALLEQEGHSREVYSVAFQSDGALAASGGLDAIGRIWDCRTGQSIMTLQGHVKKILSMDFSPNGYTVASGSEDNTCRIWDLRKRQCVYTIPAHTLLISRVKFDPDGVFILTAAFDKLAKTWSAKDFSLTSVLAGHEGKIMEADVAPDGSSRIVTVGYDRTLKYWGPQPELALDVDDKQEDGEKMEIV
ncbi:hypothetical protein BSKO_08779 [Bryopsis sp. KO-2023]|nr:hypothetical protein BSKO_08779 [Bryopsis sp. KO-2023]